jgi:hypothetical protein
VLASASTNSTSTLNDVEPGLLGFLVVAGIAVALVFLLRSMNKQFAKIGPKPEDPEADAAAGQKPLRGLALRAAMVSAAQAEDDASATEDPIGPF